MIHPDQSFSKFVNDCRNQLLIAEHSMHACMHAQNVVVYQIMDEFPFRNRMTIPELIKMNIK